MPPCCSAWEPGDRSKCPILHCKGVPFMLFRLALSLLAILALIAAVACGGPSTSPTPRPTYTPYPTFTPAPTATPQPIYTPSPATPTPPSTPDYFELESGEWFRGKAWDAFERGAAQFDAGEFQAAISSYKEAQRHHNKPSAVLENRIAFAYEFLEQFSLAIEHYSNAIGIKDTALYRVNRSWLYLNNSQCALAILDAKAALTMEPETALGVHTDVSANMVLADCYDYVANYMTALQHLEAAIAIAEEHQYDEVVMANMRLWRDELKQAMVPTPTPTPTATPMPTPTPTPTPSPAPAPTATPVPMPTPTAEERILNTINPSPIAMVYADWFWDRSLSFDEIEVTVNIHNDIDYRGRNGLYLIACTAFAIGENGAYFGLQTDVNTGPRGGWRNIGKGAIFSVWDVPDDSGVRGPAGSWVEAGDYEGDFLSVRNRYDWAEGQYTLRVAAEDTDDLGRWFGLYVNDTWIGSLRFADGAKIKPFCATPIEVYGAPVRPSDIPYWQVSMGPPIADGLEAELWRTYYPDYVGHLRNALITVDGDTVTFEIGLNYLAHE